MRTASGKETQRRSAVERESAIFSVPFAISADIPCVNAPLSVGLSIPKGRVFEVSTADVELQETDSLLQTSAKQILTDTEVLNRWHDGSIRWILLTCVAPVLAEGKTSAIALLRSAKQSNLAVAKSSSTVAFKDSDLRLDINGRQISVKATLCDQQGQDLNLTHASTLQRKQGSERNQWQSLLNVDGHPDVELRITFDLWPGAGVVDVATRILNKERATHAGGLWDLGDAGSFHFGELSLTLKAANYQESKLTYNLNGASARMTAADGPLVLVQHSSGGPAWDSSNHVNATGELSVQKNGFELIAGSCELSGLRASPTVCLSNDEGDLRIAVPEFWQQFPGSVTCNPGEGSATVGLFPKTVGSSYELQGGEQKTKRFVFSMESNESSSADNPLTWVHSPPRFIPNSDWVRQCNVIPWLPSESKSAARIPEQHERLSSYLATATTEASSLSNRRDAIDEYGWRNFGDIHADHEQTHFAGTATVVSHYNNQFDLIFGAIQNLIVSGDATWYDFFDPMARHVMDIDIYHTTQDRACFSGGLFWHTDHYVDAQTSSHRTYSQHNAGGGSYGGGPSNEHNYPTGLLYYHFLTGNEEARESVMSLADWVINMDDGRQTLFGALDGSDTGLASKTVWNNFHGPGRGVGNSINACLDGWLLTADPKYMAKAEQLIQRCVHPNQDCDALHLSDAEGHWSYTVCLTAIGRYLHIKVGDDQLDEMYEYARQTLIHYGTWMAANERPSLSNPEELEFPTEAWAAQDFRKANALRIAASCCHDAKDALQMRNAADKIHEAAWTDLYRFGDAHHTARCLSIIMTEGLRELYHGSDQTEPFPSGRQSPRSTVWTMFEFQKHRVKRTLKNPILLLKAVLTNVRPGTVRQSLDAFRRQAKS